MENMGFAYQPLESDDIRLLELVSYSPGSTPVFKIVHRSIHSKPRYAALSYQWTPTGVSTDVIAITVDKDQFWIGQNLHRALLQILQSNLGDKYIWVDAICINQGSGDERSVQVWRMRQIYEKAAKVFVWLGKPPDARENQLAFAMMEDFCKRADKFEKTLLLRQYRPWWWPKKGRSVGDVNAAFLRELTPAKDKSIFDVPDSPTHRAWLGILSLWQSEWWSRTWVFQEATIPERSTATYISPFNITVKIPSKVKFLFGDQQTDWKGLLVTSVVASHIIRTPEIDSGLFNGLTESFGNMSSIRIWRTISSIPSPLDLIQSFRMTNCSDPRDKVYAPLCLAPDDIRHEFRPDYSRKTASELYKDVVRYHIAQDASDLDFLGYVMHQEGSNVLITSDGVASTLPSWVPNFSHKLSIYPIPKSLQISVDLESRRLAAFDRRGFPNNKGTTQPSYHPLAVRLPAPYIKELALHISGVFIDHVKDIILESIPGKDKEAVLNIAREKGRKWNSDMNNEYFTGETFHDAYNRALVLDLVFDYQHRAAGRGGKYDHQLLKKEPVTLSVVEMRKRNDMVQAHRQAILCRHPALSRKNYILIVPNTAVVGDLIWAFVRGRALYLLRPIDRERKRYTFIGECYVHGFMDGEVDRRLGTGEAKLEQIYLH